MYWKVLILYEHLNAILLKFGFLDLDNFLYKLFETNSGVDWRELPLSETRVVLNITNEEIDQLATLLVDAVRIPQLLVDDPDVLFDCLNRADLIVLL